MKTVVKNKITDIVDEIDEFIEECKPITFSATSIKVDKEKVAEMITQLRLAMPDEFRKAQNIIDKKDLILTEAKNAADNMIERAKKQTEALISEHEIMQRAYEEANLIIEEARDKAQDILTKATMDANEMRTGSLVYTGGLLETLDEIVTDIILESKSKYESFLKSMEDNQIVIKENRREVDTELGIHSMKEEQLQESLLDLSMEEEAVQQEEE